MSRIEWTEKTWNPVTGCTKISPGCKHCYAKDMSHRLKAMRTKGYEQGFKLTIHEERFAQPKQREIPTMYFVNSMSDFFHEKIGDHHITEILTNIEETPRHTYQILTKRAKRMSEYFANRTVPENAWFGVSVEDRKYGVPRIDELRKIQATVLFLSVEPLLEDLGTIDLTGIHWVIVGGESGPKARQMKPEWALNIQKQCELAGVKFFFKQWGRWGSDGKKRSKKANGRELSGKIWDEMPGPR